MPLEDNTPPSWIESETEDYRIIQWPSKSVPGVLYRIKHDKRNGRVYCDCAAGRYGHKCSHIADYLRAVTKHAYAPLHGRQQTSLDAYQKIKAQLGDMHWAILGHLEEAGPLCNRDIAERSGIIISTVTARVNELRKWGRVSLSHKAKHPTTGMTVMFWRAVY